MPVLTAAERLGTSIDGTYEVESILAHGGMGVVFAATHRWTGRRVALKLLKPDLVEPTRNARLVQEARAAASLTHPNVVQVLDMGLTEDGVSYLVMELLEGRTLKDELGTLGTLRPERTLALLLPLMGAMAVAHDRGIVHRDLKPANIFLSRDPSGRTVPKVLDFGIARVIEDTGMTRSGAVLGTPQYLSPEQAQGASDVGPAADIWAFGVILHECLSGRVPFPGTHAAAIMQRVVNEPAAALSSHAPQLPPRLSAAIDRALRREPQARYADLRSFARALALTARAEDIVLPQEPDPVGLPRWREWCIGQSARDGDDAVSTTSTSSLAEVKPSRSVLRRRILWLGLLLALSVGAAMADAWLRAPGAATPAPVAPIASAPPAPPPPAPAVQPEKSQAPAEPEAAPAPKAEEAASSPPPARRQKPPPGPSERRRQKPQTPPKTPMLPW